MNNIKFAQQGVRQLAWKEKPVTNGQILKPGMTFESVYSVDIVTTTLTIPEGTIGIFHVEPVGNPEMPMEEITISVIRDDCKAARKAIRLAEASTEELEGIARRKKDRDYKLGCKTEFKQELSNGNLRLKALTKYTAPKEITYTTKEKTLKQHTLDDVCNAAKLILQSKYNYNQLCVDKLKGKSETELLTTAEMSKLVQDLVDDTLYWAGAYTSTGLLV